MVEGFITAGIYILAAVLTVGGGYVVGVHLLGVYIAAVWVAGWFNSSSSIAKLARFLCSIATVLILIPTPLVALVIGLVQHIADLRAAYRSRSLHKQAT